MQTNENDKPFSKEVEKKLSEKEVHSRHQFDGRLLQVYTDEVELPDGSRSTRDWIRHPGASAVVPVFHDGTILLVKQFRYPPRKLFLEVPAGKLDPRSEEHTSELQSRGHLVCRLLLEKKNTPHHLGL